MMSRGVGVFPNTNREAVDTVGLVPMSLRRLPRDGLN